MSQDPSPSVQAVHYSTTVMPLHLTLYSCRNSLQGLLQSLSIQLYSTICANQRQSRASLEPAATSTPHVV